jgi:hypothetical protein
VTSDSLPGLAFAIGAAVLALAAGFAGMGRQSDLSPQGEAA